MILTIEHLDEILLDNVYVNDWYNSLSEYLPQHDITTPERIAAFISQCSHESANFTRLTENLNYRWESLRRVFPKYFPNDKIAKQYEKNQKAIASRVYANRMGNGTEASGEGWAYKGRGLIQLTGKSNYQAFANFAGISLAETPAFLETTDGAVLSACWYWETNSLNRYADVSDIKGLTKAINGGYNGLDDRIEKFNKVMEIIST